jgi:hypothetical protein
LPRQRAQAVRPCFERFLYPSAMGRSFVKKPLALIGSLGTMAAVWWFALRPRLRKRS